MRLDHRHICTQRTFAARARRRTTFDDPQSDEARRSGVPRGWTGVCDLGAYTNGAFGCASSCASGVIGT
jgi:hypothetical protein